MRNARNTGWGRMTTVEQLAEAKNASKKQTAALEKGIHSTVIVAKMGMVTEKLESFYQKMEKKYPSFEVISANPVDNWKNVQVYVTYRI